VIDALDAAAMIHTTMVAELQVEEPKKREPPRIAVI